MFQSTHPHGVRLSTSNKSTRLIWVSIHAPTRGATYNADGTLTNLKSFNPRTHTGCDVLKISETEIPSVSIHAPTRGATQRTPIYGYRASGFNPRTHTGCDYPIESSVDNRIASFQSTHPHGVRQCAKLHIISQ